MDTKIIYRRPLGGQERFIISTVYKCTDNVRRGLELCKEMKFNRINFCEASETDIYDCAIACEEVAIDGVFRKAEFSSRFEYVVDEESISGMPRLYRINVIDENFSPERLRLKVYETLVQGATGIEYDSVYDGAITKKSKEGSLFYYIKDINNRINQMGRTLMALQKVSTYLPGQMATGSGILGEQKTPSGCSIGEFKNCDGDLYLMIQNQDCTDKRRKAFQLQLKKKFRVYRLNPHDGREMLVKDGIDKFNVFVMPGDADILRFQDANDEAYFIEYALKK